MVGAAGRTCDTMAVVTQAIVTSRHAGVTSRMFNTAAGVTEARRYVVTAVRRYVVTAVHRSDAMAAVLVITAQIMYEAAATMPM